MKHSFAPAVVALAMTFTAGSVSAFEPAALLDLA